MRHPSISFASRRSRLLKFPIRTSTRSHTREDSKPLPELPQEALSITDSADSGVHWFSKTSPRGPYFARSSRWTLQRKIASFRRTCCRAWTGLGSTSVRVLLLCAAIERVSHFYFSLQYDLDVSILIDQDDVRVRVPIWVY